MSAGSCAVVAATLGLAGGRRAQGGQSTTYYCYYNTVLQPNGDSEAGVPAELRVYSPKDSVVLPDNSVVFAYARVYIPAQGPALLDAIQIYPFPGDPSDDDYDNNLPTIPPFLFATGIIRSVRDVTTLDKNKYVLLEVSDRVRDGKKGFTFEAKFTGATPRWNRVPLPSLQSNAQIIGILCNERRTDGTVTIEAESLTFNALPLATSADGAGPPPSTPPAKKRKYNAYLSSGSSPMSPAESASSLAGPSGSPQSGGREHVRASGEEMPSRQPEDPETSGSSSLTVLITASAEDVGAPTAKAAGKRKAKQ
ncbi:uncharacterized protein PHACADRAFT_210712 [Phanerochaete carnosa HHB-10118-sp]|uniref:Uncharacterized protein n=1 Tax=Phanerochaete carnosa (strain HHB-10118-sp) TaxID=650164 RepID=K5W235_PHACS|nr:uncharacterized protein PHACADRAFT_210712 [Phanerochaete carnosa HHB-10118-sp]EKM52949.1 hypothetical protein PHACADRAFT_210712 [Phanerochaete carnosa HHB-10118-sp]